MLTCEKNKLFIQILDEWFGRSVIRSCVKLSYEHAQGFIEQPERQWTVEELPPISPPMTVADIVRRVLDLNKVDSYFINPILSTAPQALRCCNCFLIKYLKGPCTKSHSAGGE